MRIARTITQDCLTGDKRGSQLFFEKDSGLGIHQPTARTGMSKLESDHGKCIGHAGNKAARGPLQGRRQPAARIDSKSPEGGWTQTGRCDTTKRPYFSPVARALYARKRPPAIVPRYLPGAASPQAPARIRPARTGLQGRRSA